MGARFFLWWVPILVIDFIVDILVFLMIYCVGINK